MPNISQIKSTARDCLVNHIGIAINATLIYVFIYAIVIYFVTPSYGNIATAAWAEIASIIIGLISGLFDAGFAYFYLQIIYSDEAKSFNIFHAFKEMPYKAMLLKSLMVAVSFVCEIPLLIYEFSHLGSINYIYMIAFQLLATILTFCFTIPVSQVFYLLQDFPSQSVPSLMKASLKLMKGNFFAYLKLIVSFIPLILLSILTFGVAFLWLLPYLETSKAVFYKALMEQRQQQ